MFTHPFKPEIPKTATKLLIGTLPPEGVKFYFSNSANTRLWDILTAINNGSNVIGTGSNNLSNSEKIKILENLKIGISDIIYGYERDSVESTKDTDINPKEYKDLVQLASDNNIKELLFVYQSALKWFIHSLDNTEPVRLKKLNARYELGSQLIAETTIKCILLPSPLNRGRKDETLEFKLLEYKKYIQQ